MPLGAPTPSAAPRSPVVEIEVAAVEMFSAILAGVAVALEDVVAGEFHLLARHPVEKHEHDDARHAEAEARGLHHVGIRFARTEVAPAFVIVGGKGTIVGVDDLRVSLAEKRERPAGGADVNRLPQPVEDEHWTIK